MCALQSQPTAQRVQPLVLLTPLPRLTQICRPQFRPCREFAIIFTLTKIEPDQLQPTLTYFPAATMAIAATAFKEARSTWYSRSRKMTGSFTQQFATARVQPAKVAR